MHERRDGQDSAGHEHRHGPDCGPDCEPRGRGPEGTEFLDLEISQVLFAQASEVAKDAALDLMREAMRERLRERLGDRLRALGRLAADELADDFEANLEIEARIAARKESAGGLEQKLRDALHGGGGERAPSAAVKSSRRKRASPK